MSRFLWMLFLLGVVHISATLERQFRDYMNTAMAVLERKDGGI